MTEQTALMDDAGAPETGTPPRQPRTRWYRTPVFRDPDDDMLGGVVSGLCQSYGFDRRTSRLALVIAVPVLPIVIVAYVVAWILLPDGRDQAVPLEDIVRDKRRFPLYAALALLILAGGLGSLGSWLVFGDFPWGVGLIAIGILLWMAPGLRRDRAATAAATGLAAPMVAPTSTAGATTSWPTPAGVDATGGAIWLARPRGAFRLLAVRNLELGPLREGVDEGLAGIISGPDESRWLVDLGDGRTRLSSTAVFDSVESRDGMVASGMESGIVEGYRKLDALLAEGS